MEEYKRCSKCGEVKLVSLFRKDRNQCKACVSAHGKEYRNASWGKRNAYQKEYYEVNREKINERHRAYHAVNRDKVNEQHRAYRVANRDRALEWGKAYYNANRDKALERKKAYYKVNADKIREQKKEYRAANRDKKREYDKNRKKSDPLYKLMCGIRTLIGNSIRNNGYRKSSKTHEILGCSYEEFKVHIESQFVEGMSWDNRSEWHLDHKVPVSYAMSEGEIIALNHWSNFQPLWAVDNLRKGNRYMD